MRIAIIGGTGDLGKGLALRWAKNHDIILGSRSREKGMKVAAEYQRTVEEAYGAGLKGGVTGTSNVEAAMQAELVVLSVPFESALENIGPMKGVVRDEQLILSTVVPMKKTEKGFEYAPFVHVDPASHAVSILSAAELVAKELPPARRVVSALHTMPARKLGRLGRPLDCDILVCGDDLEVSERMGRLIEEIPGVRTVYVGPLRLSLLVESTTPLIINVATRGGIKEPLLKIVS